MKRIWNVRLNVDEFNSGIAGLDDDADRVRFLSGLHAGLNGKPTMPKGVAWEAGWTVGNSSHLEALKFGEQQRARALKRDYGNAPAMPRHDHGEAPAMPNDNLQSIIEVSTNQQTNIAVPAQVAKAPRLKSEADILIAKHPFKISGPRAKAKQALAVLLKDWEANDVGDYLTQLEEPLWPDRLIPAAVKWLEGAPATTVEACPHPVGSEGYWNWHAMRVQAQ